MKKFRTREEKSYFEAAEFHKKLILSLIEYSKCFISVRFRLFIHYACLCSIFPHAVWILNLFLYPEGRKSWWSVVKIEWWVYIVGWGICDTFSVGLDFYRVTDYIVKPPELLKLLVWTLILNINSSVKAPEA